LEGTQLLIAGGGSSRLAAMELAAKLPAQSVHFISDPEARNVPLLQSMGHVCLLPMKRGAGMSSIPSKLPAYLLSAKPVLATVDAESDTARCIQEAECGWVGEPEQVKCLAHKMAEVAALPAAELAAMGQRGRAYGLKHFSKAKGVQRLADIVLVSA
jgi:glycosyltransferase involved in cell wall biosynthesis